MSNIWELGEELLVEILCRLGRAKYAILCKSVCKVWCSLINNSRSSDSYFLRRWHEINSKDEGEQLVLLLTTCVCFTGQTLEDKLGTFGSRLILDYSSSDDPKTSELPTLNLKFLPCDQVCVVSAYKDLVLCCPHRFDHSCYYICNPFTKQWTALPPPPPLLVEGKHVSISIRVGLTVYDEDHSRASRVAVVRIVPYRKGFQDVHILVFSSNGSNGGWRKINGSDGLHPRGYLCYNVVSYNGDFVWITKPYDRMELIGCKLNPYLAYTSVYQSELLGGSFSGSPGYEFNIHTSIVGLSQGHLRLAELVNGQQKLIVWQLNHGQRQVWDKVQELNFSELKDSEDLPIARACYQHEIWRSKTSLLAFHPHEADILYLFFSRLKPTLSSYTFSCNLSKKRLELIRKVPGFVKKENFFPLRLPCWPTSVPRLD